MNIRDFIPMILSALGIKAFAEKDGKVVISDAQKSTIKSYGFTDSFITELEGALNSNAAKSEVKGAESMQSAIVQAALSQVTAQLDARNREIADLRQSMGATSADLAAKQKEIDELKEKVQVLSDMREPDSGANAGRASVKAFDLTDEAQLGGMQGEMFALNRPYNQRARAALAAQAGYQLMTRAESSFDYGRLKDDLGAFYRQSWTDRLMSALVVLPSVEAIFPLQSGYQDLATLVNLWLGEFSQSDNSIASDFDSVAKGSYEFGTETLRMFDVMFAHKYRDLKQLEKTWIGSLNKEGSAPIKWSFIEFILVETAKKLHNEREQRRINGVRRNPQPNVPGKAMEAADGLYEWLRKKVDGYVDTTPNGGTTGTTVYQVKPFKLGKITQANIGEVVYLGTSLVKSEIRDGGYLRLYMPSHMVPMYHKYLEANYGQNRDYVPGEMYVHEFPSVKIIPVPNADNHWRLIWTLEGNIQTFEQLPGEMIKFEIEQRDWTLLVHSHWKESIWAQAVGYKYTDPTQMDGSRQLIWCNEYDRADNYFVSADADKNPSVLLHTSVETVANSSLFDITDIIDAKVGVPVSIKCGVGGDKGVKITKAGKFALLSADWTPKAGDVIVLIKNADGNFIEIGRKAAAVSDAYMFAPNATAPSVAGGNKFVVGENTAATAITNLADAVVGETYAIYGNGTTNATTIANGGNFVLSDAITLSTGKSIKLVKGADGKFYEISRV